MTAFLLLCALMALAAFGLIAWPLLRASPDSEQKSAWGNRIALLAAAILIPAVAAGLYARFSNWQWNGANPQSAGLDINAMVAQLEQRLKKNPNDVDGWLMMGRSYVALGRYALAVNAYQQAYDLTQGKNVDALTGLAEAMVLVDEASLTGKAGQLIEQALALQPTSPKALWYGGLAALRAEKLSLARERFQGLLAQNPPDKVRAVLQREVQDLDQQLSDGGGTKASSPAVDGKDQRKLTVSVALAPEIKQKISEPLTLFVLAREAGKGGVPLAVVKRTSNDIPLTVELTEADAMVPTRTIASTPSIEVVARLSKSGAPLEQSGDYAGAATYSFDKQGAQGSVKVKIDRVIP